MVRNEYLIIHCTTGEDLSGDDSKKVLDYALAHGWSDHPYDGYVEDEGGKAVFDLGRSLEKKGAHCRAEGMNDKATGYAWVGGDRDYGFRRISDDGKVDSLSYAKYDLMVEKAAEWCRSYSRDVDRIKFHSELEPHKTCPGAGIDPIEFRKIVRDVLLNQLGYVTSVEDVNVKDELHSIVNRLTEIISTL